MTDKPRFDTDWLKQELRKPGRSQTALARHMGLDPSAVNRIVSGKRNVKVHELDSIMEYLSVASGNKPPRSQEAREGMAFVPLGENISDEKINEAIDAIRAFSFKRLTLDDVNFGRFEPDSDYSCVLVNASRLEVCLDILLSSTLNSYHNIFPPHSTESYDISALTRKGEMARDIGVISSYAFNIIRVLSECRIACVHTESKFSFEEGAGLLAALAITNTTAGTIKKPSSKMARLLITMTCAALAHQLVSENKNETSDMLIKAAINVISAQEH